MAVAKIASAWLFCAMVCWLLSAPADAATVTVTLSNLTFEAAAGNNSCSGQRCTESFNVTFQYDSTTGYGVGPVSVTGTGALSAADIGGAWTVGPSNDGLGHYFVYIAEFPPGPDYLTIGDTDWKYGPSGTPARGTYPYADAGLGCWESSTQCYDKFVSISGGAAHEPGAAICGTVSVTAPFIIGPLPRQGYFRRHTAVRARAFIPPCGFLKAATKHR
jgi:hypothetical protein